MDESQQRLAKSIEDAQRIAASARLCLACRFFQLGSAGASLFDETTLTWPGECRRGLPALVMLFPQSPPRGTWPLVQWNDWCGYWEPQNGQKDCNLAK